MKTVRRGQWASDPNGTRSDQTMWKDLKLFLVLLSHSDS